MSQVLSQGKSIERKISPSKMARASSERRFESSSRISLHEGTTEALQRSVEYYTNKLEHEKR